VSLKKQRGGGAGSSSVKLHAAGSKKGGGPAVREIRIRNGSQRETKRGGEGKGVWGRVGSRRKKKVFYNKKKTLWGALGVHIAGELERTERPLPGKEKGSGGDGGGGEVYSLKKGKLRKKRDLKKGKENFQRIRRNTKVTTEAAGEGGSSGGGVGGNALVNVTCVFRGVVQCKKSLTKKKIRSERKKGGGGLENF